MKDKEIYKKVLDKLYKGLKTEKHDKFKNDRLTERKFSVGDLYPDIIITKKNSDTIDFIIEIVVKEHINNESLTKKWKPLSEIGSRLFLLVPKSNLKQIEKWCEDEKISTRFGTYQIKGDKVIIKFI